MSPRSLLRWINGATDYKSKWTKSQILEMNHLLKSYNVHKPIELHRAVRGFAEIHFWKATEFRAFLLYFGIVVLKNTINEEEYYLFLLLSCATRLCYTDVYKNYLSLAQSWFDRYIEGCISMYGMHSISSNVHNLTHVVDDVKRLGSLQNISTYPFENRLSYLKQRVKQPNLPLQQITRRLVELSLVYDDKTFGFQSSRKTYPETKFPFKVNDVLVYKEVQIDQHFLLSTRKTANSWFLTFSGDIVFMKYAIMEEENVKICGTPINGKNDFFKRPISSKLLDIYESNGVTLNFYDIAFYELKSIKAKLICLPFNIKYVFIPLIHTIKAE